MANARPSLLDRIATPLALVAVVVLGLSAGAMLAEGAVLVPYWRAVPADAFLGWFRDNEPRLVAFFGPLQAAGAVLTLAAASLYGLRRRTGSGLLAASALLALAVLAVYPLYFRDVNAGFAAGTIRVDAVAGELARWSSWQWMRIALGVGALGTALLGVRQPSVSSSTRRPDRGGRMDKVNLAEKLALITEHWRPKVVGELNGQEVKLVQFRGTFVWHRHEREDELFLAVRGCFRVEFRDRAVGLGPGEFIIVPHGVEHRTVAEEEVEVLVFEPVATRNTGDVEHPILTAPSGARI